MKNFKKLFIFLIVSLFVLAGCNKPADENGSSGSETVAIPEEILGYYYDEIAGRGVLNIVKAADGSADITIDWASSAFENNHWQISATYDGSRFNYSNAVLLSQEYDSSGTHKDTEKYNDGTGYFEVAEDSLIWHNDKKDNGDDDTVFVRDYVRVDDSSIPNPWIETDNLNVALKNAGLEFAPPIEEALPADTHFVRYMSTFGTVSAVYEDNENSLLVRKSNTTSGKELTGDFNEYSKTWKESVKGLEVTCEGDGELANIAWFSVGDEHYSLSYNIGNEGKGLSMDEISSLINGMEGSDPIK